MDESRSTLIKLSIVVIFGVVVLALYFIFFPTPYVEEFVNINDPDVFIEQDGLTFTEYGKTLVQHPISYEAIESNNEISGSFIKTEVTNGFESKSHIRYAYKDQTQFPISLSSDINEEFCKLESDRTINNINSQSITDLIENYQPDRQVSQYRLIGYAHVYPYICTSIFEDESKGIIYESRTTYHLVDNKIIGTFNINIEHKKSVDENEKILLKRTLQSSHFKF